MLQSGIQMKFMLLIQRFGDRKFHKDHDERSFGDKPFRKTRRFGRV